MNNEREPNHSNQPLKILIIKPDHLGDVILVTGALKRLRQLCPQATIQFLGKEWVLPVLDENTEIDNAVPFTPPWCVKSGESHMGWTSVAQMIFKIAGERFDIAISFQEHPANNLFALLCRIPVRAGYTSAGSGQLLTTAIEPPSEQHHIYHSHVKLVDTLFSHITNNEQLYNSTNEQRQNSTNEQLDLITNNQEKSKTKGTAKTCHSNPDKAKPHTSGFTNNGYKEYIPSIVITDSERAACRKLLTDRLNIHDKFVLFHTGAGNPGKAVSQNKAAEIASAIAGALITFMNNHKESHIKLVLLGDSKSGRQVDEMADSVNKSLNRNDFRRRVITGDNTQHKNNAIHGKDESTGNKNEDSNSVVCSIHSLTIRELAALIEAATLFIGHDSGPAHLAGAVNTPTITLWGPGNPVKWSPVSLTDSPRNIIVRHQVCLNPPKRSICPDCRCLDAIKGTEIGEYCIHMLQYLLKR